MMKQDNTVIDKMTDLKLETRQLLSQSFTIDRLEIANIENSRDGSSKYLFRLKDGKFIESVLIPEKDHKTLCISSQVGCAQGCRFCLTAESGFTRNLSMGEIVSQVRDIKKELGKSKQLTNIVFMGMGEPLANYDNVVAAVQMITNTVYGLQISEHKVTISTAGMASRLYELGIDTGVNLAVSINAADNPTRDKLMPLNRKHPLEKLLEACGEYKLKPRRKITMEYILLKGVNDSEEDALNLAVLLKPVRAKINLIPFNEYDGSHFKRPGVKVIDRFKEVLEKRNYTVIIRHSKGSDISAACGQLSAKHGEN